ncbi:hypothetical protein Syun_003890 [Stephania yunnanensis]|uniref:Uncharacterized protein n=1 Tax=Stephania yunnanensis TaxID=152371 RepID=A0AAP0L1Z9_9MAGN
MCSAAVTPKGGAKVGCAAGLTAGERRAATAVGDSGGIGSVVVVVDAKVRAARPTEGQRGWQQGRRRAAPVAATGEGGDRGGRRPAAPARAAVARP